MSDRVTDRDLDTNPYSADEQRVASFFYERGTGGGPDPIGFILASYVYVVAERNDANAACLELAARHGLATGHGDTVAGMIREFSAQIDARRSPAEGDVRERIKHVLFSHHGSSLSADEAADAILALAAPQPQHDGMGEWQPINAALPLLRGRALRGSSACEVFLRAVSLATGRGLSARPDEWRRCKMQLSPYELGMLHIANKPIRRVYLGRKGCELNGYRSGRWWTALSLWVKGYLARDGEWIRYGYGSPGVYLKITSAGRAVVTEKIANNGE